MVDVTKYAKYKWDNIELEHLSDGMQRKFLYGKEIMLSQIHLADGVIVPQHSHHNEQMTQVISGQMHFWLGKDKEIELDVFPGEVLVIPAHLPHEALMVGDVYEIDIFSPPRQDWLDKTDDYLRK